MILIIDNYDSFTYNLVHLVAANTSHYNVVRNDRVSINEIAELNPAKILISPGPGRPEHAGLTPDIIRTFGKDTPILGVCLGHQAIGMVFGGSIVHAPALMHGKTSEILHNGTGIYKNISQNFTATRYHSLVIDPETLPAELECTAYTKDRVIMGVRHKSRPIEGIQFHPESILTIEGPKLISNWVLA